MSAYRDRINKQKQNTYFRASDLDQVKELTLTIAYLVQDEMVFEHEKDVLYFSDDARRLVLNYTNIEALMDLLGDEPADWPNHRITLYQATYHDRKADEDKPCIRVRGPGTGASPPPVPNNGPALPVPLPLRARDLDDEIPF
jgi:hypothetical protein